ncbi:MAG: YkgJ family cysteine cluster protein [Chlamydiales bacterium]
MEKKKGHTWYRKGLRFQCTGCGKCCTGSPGYVWVNEKELEKIADFLQIPVKECIRRYVRRVAGRYSLTESKSTYDCVFLKNNQCQIYEARPTQCRTFPWWPEHLESENSWEAAAKTCEGICGSAPVVSHETIEEQKLVQIKRNEKN